MKRKPGETVQEVAACIRQAMATCDFTNIENPLDEALRTCFICSINNEAVLKAFFKINYNKLTFEKAVQVTTETKEAAMIAKVCMVLHPTYILQQWLEFPRNKTS